MYMLYRSYDDYLNSDHWKKLRLRILDRDGRKCVICPKDAEHVHHINYRNWVDVLDTDLISVCGECHTKIHIAIDNGFIQMNNHSSLQCTKNGLHNMSCTKIELHKKAPKKKFELDAKWCEETDSLPRANKQRICGVLKHSMPRSFVIFEGRIVSEKMYRDLLKAKSFRPKSTKDIGRKSKKPRSKSIDRYTRFIEAVRSFERRISVGNVLTDKESRIYNEYKRILIHKKLYPLNG